MDNNMKSLSYSDENDKAYGIAGMTVTLVALDGEEYLAEISLDAPAGETMRMSTAYGLKGNPRMSAKILWEQAVRELRLTTSMALGNLVCRRYLVDRTGVSRSETDALRKAVRTEAQDHCELDSDEADNLFDNCLSYVDRLFRHSGVQQVTHSFADNVMRRRTMSAAEAFELLSQLGMR